LYEQDFSIQITYLIADKNGQRNLASQRLLVSNKEHQTWFEG
jgi:hypothetical protein